MDEEEELARQARAIEVLERLGSAQDRTRGAQARQALDSFVQTRLANGARFSAGLGRLLTQVGVRGAEFFDETVEAGGDFLASRPATGAVQAARSAIQGAAQSANDTVAGFINPESAAIDPALQAQFDELSAADPLATSDPRLPANPTASIENFGTTVAPAQPAAVAPPAAPQVPVGVGPNTQAILDNLTQQSLELGNQANIQQLAEIQNALNVDEFNRAQAASQLVGTPQAQFSPAQNIGNAALSLQGQGSTVAGAVGAFQQLSPSANIQSVQPALNASAAQSRSVNSAEQGANRASTRSIQEAKELADLKRQAFIRNVVIPGLSQPRDQ